MVDSTSGEDNEVFQHRGRLDWESRPAWSPDGRHIALAWYEPQGTDPLLHVLDLETSEAVPLIDEPYPHRILGWTADGQWLAVSFLRGSNRSWFIHWDGACWVRPPELEGTSWLAFSGESAQLLASYEGRHYLINLREALGANFPEGVLSCP